MDDEEWARLEIDDVEDVPGGFEATCHVTGIKASESPTGGEAKVFVNVERDGVPITLALAPVVIVKPDRIAAYENVPPRLIEPVNILMNSSSTPAAPEVRAPNVMLASFYGYPVSYTILDQFGDPLPSSFQGAKIEEDKNGTYQSINSPLSDTAEYADPVGRISEPLVFIVPSTSAEAAGWPFAAPVPPKAGWPKAREITSFNVRVDGEFVIKPPSGDGKTIIRREARFTPAGFQSVNMAVIYHEE